MKFLEKDLEDIIWESDNERLIEKGLNITGVKKRQLTIGSYGVADIVTFDRICADMCEQAHLNITVYELKKEKAGISAFLQALRYCKGISSYLIKHKPLLMFKLNIVLCAKEIDTSSDYIFLSDFIMSDYLGSICSLRNYSFKYGIDGIIFKKEEDYDLSNKGF